MSHSTEKRYETRSQAIPLTKGLMYFGEDTSLRREVILINVPFDRASPDEHYLRKLRQASTLVNNGFHHILDTVFEEDSLMLVLQHKPGDPLSHKLHITDWPFEKVVTAVANLGVSMLDAMEEQISGYSVSADNLWLNENNRLSVIQYWEDGQPQTQGAIGLCGLMLQLFTGSTQIQSPYEPIDNHLERIAMTDATPEQQEKLIKLVKRVCLGEASLSTLIFGLRELPSSNPTIVERQYVQASTPALTVPATVSHVRPFHTQEVIPIVLESQPVQASSTFNKKIIAGVSVTILAAILIWVWGPFSSNEAPPPQATNEPDQSLQPPTPSATPAPSPTPSQIVMQTRDGVEISMPTLIGMTQADAEQAALSSRLRYNYVLDFDSAPPGRVFKQEPAAGSKVITGDEIKFWISKSSP
ncbi:MAG: hypothetical protein K0Q73_3306 [Paenibacillus sp.]|nr:hypothetical protein [Paenibacillus sp.]